MYRERKYLYSLVLFLFVCILAACNQNSRQDTGKKQQEVPSQKTKPGATGTDSLKVSSSSVVFFEPDSIQLEKIRKITKDEVFKTSVHEYFYMSRNAKAYIQEHRPELKILEAKNFRYIVFTRSDASEEIIDLDKLADAWGMYVFDPKKTPQLSDMMNVDTEIPRYFSK